MKRQINIWKSIDWLAVSIYLILTILGWLNIYAAVYNDEHQSLLDLSQRYGKQLIWILLAIIIAFTIFLFDSNFFSYFAYPVYIFFLVFLLLVLFFGDVTNNQRAWFEIGSFKLQPSEFMKFATNLALAKYMSSFNYRVYNSKNLLLTVLLILIPVSLIILQGDTGTALVFFALIFSLYREGLSPFILFFALIAIVLFLASMLIENLIIIETLLILAPVVFYLLNPRLRYILWGLLIFSVFFISLFITNLILNNYVDINLLIFVSVVLSSVPVLLIARRKKIVYASAIVLLLNISVGFTFTVDYIFHKVLVEHQQKRINELLGITFDPLGTGYNVNQSKIAIGSGGFTGKGFLQGTQTKYNFVPEQSTDFIFCTIGEEHGFVGSFVVLGLFVLLLLRLVYLAERQRSIFNRVYGYGVVSILFFHLIVNIGMTIGLSPVIGIPLPFFSYGGSSLWSFTILLFIFIKLDSSRFELMVK